MAPWQVSWRYRPRASALTRTAWTKPPSTRRSRTDWSRCPSLGRKNGSGRAGRPKSTMSLAVDVLARPHGAVRRRDCLVSNEWRAPYTLASRYDAQQMSLAFLPSRRTAVALGVLTLLNALHHSDPVDNFKVAAMRPLMTPHPDDLGEDRPVFGVPQQIVPPPKRTTPCTPTTTRTSRSSSRTS